MTTPAQSQPPPPPPPARTTSTSQWTLISYNSQTQRRPSYTHSNSRRATNGDRPAVALLHVHNSNSTSYHTHVHNFPDRSAHPNYHIPPLDETPHWTPCSVGSVRSHFQKLIASRLSVQPRQPYKVDNNNRSRSYMDHIYCLLDHHKRSCPAQQ